MAKKYKGSLTLDWYNKQKSIINVAEDGIKSDSDIPAPKINWINKEESLFYEIDKDAGAGLTPYWVDRDDIRVKEARPLKFQKAFRAVAIDKEGSLPGMDVEYNIEEIDEEIETDDIDNILIKGDNLLALNTLKKYFDKLPDSEKVKCIYIDPPYNIEVSNPNYDDNLARSEWLTLMRDRLKVLRTVLSNNGIIFTQIDSENLHYLKIVFDEVFGCHNMLKQINWQRSPEGRTALGQGVTFINTQTEYILIYSKDRNACTWNSLEKKVDATQKILSQYNIILQYNRKLNDSTKVDDKNEITVREYSKYEMKKVGNKKVLLENYHRLVQSVGVQKESTAQQRILNHLNKKNILYEVDYILKQGKDKGKKVTSLYFNGRKLIFASDYSSKDNDIVYRFVPMNDFWRSEEINVTGIAKEGGVDFKRSKKPEKLIQRILELSTDENDLVLDSFVGSGTTSAVAHKLKRRWIGIEIGNHADTHIIPRIKIVLNGKDQSGISKSVSWKGGGSFKYYHLGESIINVDEETGKGEFNWSLGKKFIQESLLSSYDFTPIEDKTLFSNKLFQDEDDVLSLGKIKGSNKNAIYGVVDITEPGSKNLTITNDEIKTIYSSLKRLKDFQSLIVYTNKGIDVAQDSIPEDLEIIKVPHAIFAELER